MRWLRRIVRLRGMRKVKEVGVQADFEMDHEGTGGSTGQPGHQEDRGSVEVALCPGPGIMGAGMELSDEEKMDWGPGAWYCRDVDPARQLADKFLHDLAEEEDQIARILKCQALRLIAGHLPGTSLEFREIISELTLSTRINVNREQFVSFESGIGEMQQWDRFNDESMARFRTQVAWEASLNRMNERISSLLLRTELCASRPLKLALKRCFKAWKVAARLRIEELRFHIQGWERRMIKMEGLMYERMLPRSTNLNFVLQDDQEEPEEVAVSAVETAPLSFKEAIELTTSAIIDSRRPRPPALTYSMVRKVMVRLELIDQEESPLLRLKECRELRQTLHGLDGVPAFIGDLHEELYALALMEVPDGNWMADPVIPASPSSGKSSADQDPWLDERDPCYPSTPEDDGSSGCDS
ncbi:hypothetical protein MLD38_029897 [Melastoma candidum]|uniref:Uncharacterized protein n=1 Tax=Melastoma candidum TaxID=119954 RepID=A0ACB9MJR9_9MYRT|nr:hypothetical protein MLD38_029897 [Melastoma candidum]